jgi:hypothetical protein
MQRYEYKVVPAPRRGQKGKGVKGSDGKFAHALQQLMNEYGAAGWEYQRAETLPCDERVGLTGTKTLYQNLLVFRRALPETRKSSTANGAVLPETPVEPDEAPEPEAEKAPRLGGVSKGDPGQKAKAPDVTA